MSANEPLGNEPIDISTRPLWNPTPTADRDSPSPSSAAHLYAAATGQSALVTPFPHPPTRPPEQPTPPSTDQLTSPAGPFPTELPAQFRTSRPNPWIDDARAVAEAVDYRLVREHATAMKTNVEGSRRKEDFDIALAGGPETDDEQAAFTEIQQLVDDHVNRRVLKDGDRYDWTQAQKQRHGQAVFDHAFRLGRLQPLLREEGVEDISIASWDTVFVTYQDGRRAKFPPVADNDADLGELINNVATARGSAFARPHGRINLDLGGARMVAHGAQITSATKATIRKHNYVDETLQGLLSKGTISRIPAELLSAAVRANRSALVSGWASAGKTTFLRGWMSAVEPWEKIVTIETDKELYLHKLPHRHWDVVDLQSLESASGDGGATFTLHQALYDALRHSSERILFGEIRGPEGPAAIAAMLAGKGSISTIHARSADDAIHRLADILMSEHHLTEDIVPLRQILRSVDLIVHLELFEATPGTPRRRIVTEIAEVAANGSGLPYANVLVRWDHDRSRHVIAGKPSTPEFQRTLERAGLSPEFFWGIDQ